MQNINLHDLDLNLLVALQALLTEKNVTRAAEQMGRSQPTASRALGRLRELFEDPLLVPGKGGMMPTPLAEQLELPLARALRQIESLLQLEQSFDPATTRRPFTLGCPDALGVLLAPLLGWFNAQAPQARLLTELPDRGDLQTDLEQGRFDIALAPTPREPGASLRQLQVGAVRWEVLMRPDHPLSAHERLELEHWLAYPHIVIQRGSASRSAVAQALESAGQQRKIGLTLPGFLLGLRATAASDMLFTAPHIVARDGTQHFNLRAFEPPLPIPSLPVAVLWNERWESEQAHAWFRQGVAAIARASW